MPSWSDRLAPRPPLVALGFAAGIAGAYTLGSMLALGAAALAVLAANAAAGAAWREVRRQLAVPLAALALGALVQGLRGRDADRDAGEQDVAASRTDALLRGAITRPPAPRGDGRFELTMETDDDRTVRVQASRAALPGDEVVVVGRLRPPRGVRNPGSPDRAAAARAEGIDAELAAESLEIVGRRASPWLAMWRATGQLRDRWARAIAGATAPASPREPEASPSPPPPPPPSPPSADLARAVLAGVVLGVRGDIPPELDERWRAVGIYHVLSVSGLHLAVVALLLFAGLRRLAAALGTRADPARIAIVPALAAALGYTLLTGAQVATLRALLVAGLWMLARALGRPLHLVDALAVAALVLLAWSPAQLWQPSFQLSFAAALALARPPAAPSSDDRRRWRRALAHLRRGTTTSAWVALVTAPITAYHFHQVQPGGVIGNLVLTPLVELCALPLGLLGLVAGELWPAAGAVLLDSAAAAIRIADALAAWLHPLCPVGTVAIASPLVAAALWAGTTALCGRQRRGLLDAAAWCGLCALWIAAPLPPPEGVRVVFLDVGQGDAALIETGSEVWLVDAGGAPGAATAAAAAAPGRAIVRYLELSRRARIDLAVISHPHPDHYLGLLALEGAVAIGELWLPPGFVDDDAPALPAAPAFTMPSSARSSAPVSVSSSAPSSATSFRDVVERLRRAGTLIRPPPPHGRRSREGALLTLVAPRYRERAGGPERLAADPVRTVNDNSAVVTLDYAARRVLFPGDVELEGEEALIAALPPAALRADVVKVPHHGSRTSSSPRFVDAVAPHLAVVSCGAANRFGFPAVEVVARWRAAGADVLRTDRGGAVIVELSPDGGLTTRRR